MQLLTKREKRGGRGKVTLFDGQLVRWRDGEKEDDEGVNKEM